MKKTIKVLFASLASIALTLGIASTAQAAGTRALAPNNVLYALDGAGGGTYGTLNRIDPMTATATVVGSRGSAANYDFPYQAAFNPADGLIYWSGATSDGERLMRANPRTGASTFVAEFKENGVSVVVNAIAISSTGAAYGTSNNKLYSLNLSTGAVTQVGSTLPRSTFYSFAFNPADSQFYAMSNDSNGGLYRIDVTSGTATQLIATGSLPDMGAGTGANARRWYSMAFDKNGSLWAVNRNGDIISSVVTGNNAADFASNLEIVGTPGSTGTNSLAITYPTSSESGGSLANTGTQEGLIQALSVTSGLVIVAGATLMMFVRRRNS